MWQLAPIPGSVTVTEPPNLFILTRHSIIKGGYDSTTWAQNPILNPTILDAQGQGHVLVITGNITPTVEGFHLTNGSAANGGGVYVDIGSC